MGRSQADARDEIILSLPLIRLSLDKIQEILESLDMIEQDLPGLNDIRSTDFIFSSPRETLCQHFDI